jgi:diguanylate cyclase (GGDEF)-like protein
MFPVPPDEPARLDALDRLDILDTPAEPLFDDVVRLAAHICRAPIAVVNFVDADRQWGKALVGLEDSEAPREVSFCARTILEHDGVMVVPDTLADPAWAGNPMVTGEPFLRFYAGAVVRDPDGQPLGTVCIADTEPRTLEREALDALRALARQTSALLALRRQTVELAHVAVTDGLTNLPNRTLLYDRLAVAIRQAARSGDQIAVLFCDLDGFKRVNDQHGHEAGDTVLRAVAGRLESCARDGDTVARLGGDEFVAICPGLAGDGVLAAIAARFASAVAQPVDVAAGVAVVPRLTIGAVVAEAYDDPDEILQRADQAMDAAKTRPVVA